MFRVIDQNTTEIANDADSELARDSVMMTFNDKQRVDGSEIT